MKNSKEKYKKQTKELNFFTSKNSKQSMSKYPINSNRSSKTSTRDLQDQIDLGMEEHLRTLESSQEAFAPR